MSASSSDRLIPAKTVVNRTSLCRATIYTKMKAGEFPQSVPISGNRVAWREADISAWIASKLEAVAV